MDSPPAILEETFLKERDMPLFKCRCESLTFDKADMAARADVNFTRQGMCEQMPAVACPMPLPAFKDSFSCIVLMTSWQS